MSFGFWYVHEYTCLRLLLQFITTSLFTQGGSVNSALFLGRLCVSPEEKRCVCIKIMIWSLSIRLYPILGYPPSIAKHLPRIICQREFRSILVWIPGSFGLFLDTMCVFLVTPNLWLKDSFWPRCCSFSLGFCRISVIFPSFVWWYKLKQSVSFFKIRILMTNTYKQTSNWRWTFHPSLVVVVVNFSRMC